MKILIDENMPYAYELFSEFAEVKMVAGRNITADMLVDVDVLLIRSVTKVNAALLEKANKLKLVGTATIGTDHIDTQYLKSKGIDYTSAPGCNRFAVAEYVLSCLLTLSQQHGFDIKAKQVAIIGAGNTGSAVAEKLQAIGVETLLCDPPLLAQGDERQFVSLTEALRADIISLHVPLTLSGEHATHHLISAQHLNSLKPEQILINACRGPVIDNQALLNCFKNNTAPISVLDVWEQEPEFEQALLPYVSIATAHIAGYSLEGKARGTWMLYEYLANKYQWQITTQLESLLPSPTIEKVSLNQHSEACVWQSLFPLIYNVSDDDRLFRQHAIETGGFDRLRKTYRQRRECSSLSIDLANNTDKKLATMLSRLSFQIIDG